MLVTIAVFTAAILEEQDNKKKTTLFCLKIEYISHRKIIFPYWYLILRVFNFVLLDLQIKILSKFNTHIENSDDV